MKTTPTISVLRTCRCKSAFTLVESMILVVILGITAAVVGQSLTTMVNSAAANNLTLLLNDQLLSEMENLRANYKSLATGPVNTNVTLNGNTYTMTRDIEEADPTGGTNPVATFLSLTVTINGQKMTTYVSE